MKKVEFEETKKGIVCRIDDIVSYAIIKNDTTTTSTGYLVYKCINPESASWLLLPIIKNGNYEKYLHPTVNAAKLFIFKYELN